MSEDQIAPVDDLSEAALDAFADEAARAFDAASDLEALNAARLAHLGEKSPLALSKRALGSIPKEERKDAGKRVNVAQGRARAAYEQRKTVLDAERDAAVLVSESIDVTLPS
ncbi:phenylalanine--tRNA ligase subunit alpha, partial [Tsukamurella tyrosinosolvens]